MSMICICRDSYAARLGRRALKTINASQNEADVTGIMLPGRFDWPHPILAARAEARISFPPL